MGLQESFAALSDVLGGYESQGRAVRDVEVTATDADGGALRATLDIPVSLHAGSDGSEADVGVELTPEAAALTDDGDLRVDVPADDLADPPVPAGVSVEATPRDVRVSAGALVATVELVVGPAEDGSSRRVGTDPAREDRPTAQDAAQRVDADAGGDDHDGGDTRDPLVAARDESVPPYEDVPYLRRLYEACDSFAEMSREIPMDVSAETVRRYMIDADVHDPKTYDTAAETEPEPDEPSPAATDDPIPDVPSEQLVTDGVGLPADLELADVADAVADARTTYEVHRDLGIDQERTRELLRQLDLLDLVLRRVGDDPDRRVSYDEIAARIRGSVPAES